jgi:acyl-CoA synthetase (AMP-forming)/AMP-acid ligase II
MTITREERKTLARIVTERARSTPGRVFAVVPRSDKLEGGFRDVSYGELDLAVDRMAWWLDEKLGPVAKHQPRKERVLETLAYAGATDLRYNALIVAAIKSRRKVCLSNLGCDAS